CAQCLATESLGACLNFPVPVCDPTELASSTALNGAIVTACMMFKMWRGATLPKNVFQERKTKRLSL
ncbi:hypothetical protein LEMLEM_LOCUS20158, partial [Lemmus lemmus]